MTTIDIAFIGLLRRFSLPLHIYILDSKLTFLSSVAYNE